MKIILDPTKIITVVNTITIPALPLGYGYQAFNADSKLNIQHRNCEFNRLVTSLKNEGPSRESKILVSSLKKSNLDTEIVALISSKLILGWFIWLNGYPNKVRLDRIKVSLGQFAWLLEQQPNGESQSLIQNRCLLTDAWNNFCYIQDGMGVFRVVSGDFYSGSWNLYAYDFEDGSEWSKDCQVISSPLCESI